MQTKTNLLERLSADFETVPVVEHNSNVFTTRDYMTAVGIGKSAAQHRIAELMRRHEVRKIKVRLPEGLRPAFEYIGKG
jgi:excinuclease UvrABC ATPase subunit